jgi:hypothetical protein
MEELSRRTFIGQGVAATLATTSTHHLAAFSLNSSENDGVQKISTTARDLFANQGWKPCGRLTADYAVGALRLQDGFILSSNIAPQSCTFSFEARAPEDASEVQVWAGIKCRDRDSRYLFGIRGGTNNDVYLARYAPEGGNRFLGVARLPFHPEVGEWYRLRAETHGGRIHIYVGNEPVPSINVEDREALWDSGAVSLGGGWLPAEFRQVKTEVLAGESLQRFIAMESRYRQETPPDRALKRTKDRAAYRPVTIKTAQGPRYEVALDGQWLFMPDQDLSQGAQPEASTCSDDQWHVLDIPRMWTPTLTWLHHETGFDLPGLSKSKGIADNLYASEIARLDSYTFDWRNTKSAWYRHHLVVPNELSGKRIALCFDAVAKVCSVFVNGTKVGQHTGMFAELVFDVSKVLRPGHNVIAVHVIGQPAQPHSGNTVSGVAVTVEVTEAMLNSLPHGMYPEEASGIWQPVYLRVMEPTSVDEVYLRPSLDRLEFSATISRADPEHAIDFSYEIVSASGKESLHKETSQLRPGVSIQQFETPVLNPKPWSPDSPNLYKLEITLWSKGGVIDRHTTTFGFKIFEVKGNRLFLNGRPYWLRGANHFPHALAPNDPELARRFVALAREGNVSVTRSHTAPFTKTWLEACDELGMGVSFEGTWPWLMLQGDPPEPALLKAWKEEFASLIRQFRNHPSLLFWTVNNEMKFEVLDRSKPARLTKKWEILNDMMSTIRTLDPTRPVVCDSSYVRKQAALEYQDLIAPRHFDDGDMDDRHAYFGWYERSFFHYFRGEFGKQSASKSRPLISQEMSTGYSSNDDGHAVRFYTFKHYTALALVGDEAYEHRNPKYFLEQQALSTKELAEAFRRSERSTSAGILHFAYVSWFRNVTSPGQIQPYPCYHALKKALQPVLVSAELWGRNFVAGREYDVRICIANDSDGGVDLSAGEVYWSIQYDGTPLSSGRVTVASTPYYSNTWVDAKIQLPAQLPREKIALTLHLEYHGGQSHRSENEYSITAVTERWANKGIVGADRFCLLDPARTISESFRAGLCNRISRPEEAPVQEVLVVASAESVLRDQKQMGQLCDFINAGGRALLLKPGRALPDLCPNHVLGYKSAQGENAWMWRPESSAFEGLSPLDLSWFDMGRDNIPKACSGTYTVNWLRNDLTVLAYCIDRHGYLKRPEQMSEYGGSPLLQIQLGKGTLIASEMELDSEDPVAKRLLGNLLGLLQTPSVTNPRIAR